MPHPPPRRGSPSSNEGDNGLGHSPRLVILLQKLCGLFLAGAANLADEDDALRIGVIEEDLERLGVRRPRKGVAANTYHERLPESHQGCLCDGFVCERTRAGDNPYVRR